jgi:hypothetical protein
MYREPQLSSYPSRGLKVRVVFRGLRVSRVRIRLCRALLVPRARRGLLVLKDYRETLGRQVRKDCKVKPARQALKDQTAIALTRLLLRKVLLALRLNGWLHLLGIRDPRGHKGKLVLRGRLVRKALKVFKVRRVRLVLKGRRV